MLSARVQQGPRLVELAWSRTRLSIGKLRGVRGSSDPSRLLSIVALSSTKLIEVIMIVLEIL